MCTLTDIEKAIWNLDTKPCSVISPIKVWEYKSFIKGKLDEIENIKTVYPLNFFGIANDKQTEFFILDAEENLLHGKLVDNDFKIAQIDGSLSYSDISIGTNEIAFGIGLNLNPNLNQIQNAMFRRRSR